MRIARSIERTVTKMAAIGTSISIYQATTARRSLKQPITRASAVRVKYNTKRMTTVRFNGMECHDHPFYVT